MKQILKRTFVIIITFVLVFAISIPCLASDNTHGGGGGWHNNMTREDKVNWFRFNANSFLNQLLGLDEKTADRFAVDLVKPYLDTKGYSSMEEYFADHINYDEDTQTFIPDDTFVADINVCLQQYDDTVTMAYRYAVSPDNLDYSVFEHKSAYEELYKFIKNHPEYYFICYVKASERWGSTCIWLQCFDFDSAVSADYNLVATSCSLYDSEWNSPVKSYQIGINDIESDTGQFWAYAPADSPSATQTGKTASEIDDLLNSGGIGTTKTVSSGVLVNSRTFKTTLISNCVFSFKNEAINCYKSVVDMKKDIGSQVIGGYTPDYTGKCAPSVSLDIINNVGTGGGSSGSDDSSGGSSGGGIFDDIISGIANGVGSIIKGVFSIIKDLVDAIADAIVSITKSITDLMGLLKGDFTSFLSAVFPFMPQEFIKIMVASLALCLLGVIIKIFRG